MNKKDFKRYMQQGLGRCVLTLQTSKSISKYKDIVLWGCLHNLSYDTQCEGTRASYVYELTTFFNDEAYFVFPIIDAFENLPCRHDWLFSHFCELLRRFAENGNVDAKNALQRKYDQLLSTLLHKRRFTGYDFDRDNFERICISLSSMEGMERVLQIASDMGRLFKDNPHYSGWHFGWFCSCMDDGIGKKRLLSILKREAKKSETMSCFYENYLKEMEEIERPVRKPIEVPSVEDMKKEITFSGKLSPSSRVRFSRRAENEEKIKLAEDAIAEPDLDIKGRATICFFFSR